MINPLSNRSVLHAVYTEKTVNAGYDIHATGLKEAETQSSTQAKEKSSTTSSGHKGLGSKQMKKFSFCIHDDTTMRQKMFEKRKKKKRDKEK
ncbi:hypothetical protein LINPERHAP2_LOCUS15894 [Linum perenne]